MYITHLEKMIQKRTKNSCSLKSQAAGEPQIQKVCGTGFTIVNQRLSTRLAHSIIWIVAQLSHFIVYVIVPSRNVGQFGHIALSARFYLPKN